MGTEVTPTGMSARNWIREQRLKRGLSQARLARIAGISQGKISSWETGKSQATKEGARKILKVFGQLDADLRLGRTQRIFPRASHAGRESSELKRDGGQGGRRNKTPLAAANHQAIYRPSEARLTQVARESDHARHLLEFDARFDPNGPTAIALFAGCGGMSLGFKWSGFQIVGYAESEEAFRTVYELNFPGVPLLGSDVSKIGKDSLVEWRHRLGDIDVIFGGPPCQGFSLAGKRDRNDSRNELYLEFTRLASFLRPKTIVMENVRLITSMRARSGGLVTDDIIAALSRAGYRCDYQILNAQDYGVPQFRERFFLIGIRNDLAAKPISFPRRTHRSPTVPDLIDGDLKPWRTFRDAAGDLEPLESGESSTSDPLHFAVWHPEHVIRMLKDVAEGKSAHENADPRLRPASGYNTTYKRIRWDEPCSTIGTTFGMISASRNVHPTNTRSLTIREALRCQSFPDDFMFTGTLGQIRTMIGNAVPPLLAKAVADHIVGEFLTHHTRQPFEDLASR